MTFTTKFDADSMAWVMHENKPLNCSIERVEAVYPHGNERRTLILYYMMHIPHYFLESDVYETKEALLQSL